MKYIKVKDIDNIRVITVNKPEVLNALDGDVLRDLDTAVEDVRKAGNIFALIITGEGRSFVAGADIGAQSVLDVAGGREWGRNGSAIFRKIETLEIPVIAAVNGFALGGGCELALACDIILAGEKAKFGQPEVGLGITPGFSGTQRLARAVGTRKAKELIFTGKMIKADEAKEIGLANAVYPQEELMDKALEMAKEITANAPVAVKYSKAAIDRGVDMDIDNGIAVENELFAMCFGTDDQKEGMKAFLEKRKAEFKNR